MSSNAAITQSQVKWKSSRKTSLYAAITQSQTYDETRRRAAITQFQTHDAIRSRAAITQSNRCACNLSKFHIWVHVATTALWWVGLKVG